MEPPKFNYFQSLVPESPMYTNTSSQIDQWLEYNLPSVHAPKKNFQLCSIWFRKLDTSYNMYNTSSNRKLACLTDPVVTRTSTLVRHLQMRNAIYIES